MTKYPAVKLALIIGISECILMIAAKLGESADTVQHGVEGLMYLLTESTKLQVQH